jgi:hypothetical protein
MGWRPRRRLQILGGRVKRSLAGQAKPTETRATPMEIPELRLPTCGKHVDNKDGPRYSQQVSRGGTHSPSGVDPRGAGPAG